MFVAPALQEVVLAEWAKGRLDEPKVDALLMEDVTAIEDTTDVRRTPLCEAFDADGATLLHPATLILLIVQDHLLVFINVGDL